MTALAAPQVQTQQAQAQQARQARQAQQTQSQNLAGSGVLKSTEQLQHEVQRGIRPVPAPVTGWTWTTFSGRLTELSSGRANAALSLAVALVREAQLLGEPVAWIGRPGGSFFPPDAATCGVDLEALPVIHPRSALDSFRAADHLLRCGAFGLIVLDMPSRARMPMPVQTRLSSLAKKHETAMLCLTEKESQEPSLGSLVSLRAQVEREVDRSGKHYRCRAKVLKDKRRGPGWEHLESFRGPPGVC